MNNERMQEIETEKWRRLLSLTVNGNSYFDSDCGAVISRVPGGFIYRYGVTDPVYIQIPALVRRDDGIVFEIWNGLHGINY